VSINIKVMYKSHHTSDGMECNKRWWTTFFFFFCIVTRYICSLYRDVVKYRRGDYSPCEQLSSFNISDL